jgi:hypothetical protein
MSTRFSSTLLATNDTDAHFRNWAQFIEDTLVTTGGWVVTGDTGQTAPGSLTHPTVANTKQGYRIYRMADTLQSTNPVFVRIDFGSGPATTIPGIWLTIGTGSDGAGAITGTVWNGGGSATANIAGNTSSSTQVNNCYGSADTNRVTIGMFVQASNAAFDLVFGIERTKDATGADTGTGLLLAYTFAGAQVVGRSRFLILAGGTQPTEENGLSYILTRQNPSETFGSDIGCGILIHFKGVAQQPGTNFMMVNSNDVSAEGQFSMTLYGATRTYQHMNTLATQKALSGSNVSDANCRVGIRYD